MVVGQTLGHYRIQARIGAGGMGEVYRARDTRLDRDVALKLLPADSFADAAARARLVREARTASKLNHPYICTIHDVGESEGRAYIAMELVDGEPLSARLAEGPLPFDEAALYGLQLADALAHAHDRGIVHRDVKSANVIVTPEGRVKVLDFGLAKHLTDKAAMDASTEKSLTGLGEVAGTVAYMAPELLRGLPADARSDIWALGVVLYEMVAGARPFSGQTGFEVSSAVLSQPPRPLPPNVPSELRTVIERCLEKDPERRFHAGSDVRAALEHIQTGRTAGQGRVRRLLGARHQRTVAGTLVALALLIPGAIVWFNLAGIKDRLLGGAPGTRRIESLAVLPLTNSSGDAGQEFLSDGMTEALIADLSRLGTFKRIVAPGSVMRYKGTKKPLTTVGRELGVDALLTGSVLRSGNRVRVIAQLVDAGTEDQIWTDSYQRDLRDVLTLQNEIVSSIAAGIKVKLSPQEEARLAKAPTVNPEAYEAVVKGRFHLTQLRPDSQQTALQYFEGALKKDPNYAAAYAGIAMVWTSRGHMGIIETREASVNARPYAKQALQLDDQLADSHLLNGTISLYLDWDWPAAERYLRRAIELNPSDSQAHLWFSDLLNASGRTREALAEIERGLEMDPLNFFVQTSAAGRLLRLGRADTALELLQRAVKTEPNLVLAHRYFWPLYHLRKMEPEATAAARDFFVAGGHPDVAAAIDRGYRDGGYTRAMRMAGDALAARAKTRYIQPTQIATLYAHAGDRDRAFEWLDRAYELRDSWLVFLKDDPRFENLHADPRFERLVQKMKFPS
jgi:TolB-like protein/tetratricopeptide (TPR) repeat protein/tRNA A-37 threonylcarbamoyl transferase component Bud32